MHIQIQCCGVVLMLALLFLYVHQKRIALETQKAFLGVFWASFFCIIFDIFSIIVIEYRHVLSELFAKLIVKTYLVTLLGVAISALAYMCVDIYARRDEYRHDMRKYLALWVAGVIGTYLVPLYYNYSSDGSRVLYTYGPSVYVTYGVSLVLFLRIFYLIRKEKARINPRRREAVCIWLVVWIVASQIQFMYTSLLIVGYAGSIGIMVLYLKLENPETNLDRSTGLFNGGALYQYMKQLFAEEKDFSVLVLFFENGAYQNVHTEKRRMVRMEIVEYLLKLQDALAFKNAEDEYFILFAGPEDEFVAFLEKKNEERRSVQCTG